MAQDAHKTIRDTAGRHGTTQDTHRTTRVEIGHAGRHGTLRGDIHRRKTLLENLRPPPECPRTLEDPDPSPIVWLIVGILGGVRFLLPAGLTFE